MCSPPFLKQVPGRVRSTIPWFDPVTGAEMFRTHPLNDRGNRQSVLRYLSKIRQFGVVPSARGDPYAVVSRGCKPPYWLISFGTLATAFYKAISMGLDKEFPNVKASLDNGLPNVTLLVEQFPSDGIAWLREFANDFHDGDDVTLVQMYDEHGSMQAEWDCHRLENGIDSKTGKDFAR